MTKILAWDCSPKVPSLIPFFLPFAGCPFRCLYCAQDLVTGQEHHDPLSLRFQRLHKELLQRRRPDRDPPQLAFYGGTFTALPLDAMNYCLEQAQHLLEQGLISALRCSTRPDALPDDRLLRLREAGMTTIELGIQSFDEGALRATERGYGSIKACEACTKVKDYGFELGVQLLPGMPGLSPGRFPRMFRMLSRWGQVFYVFIRARYLPKPSSPLSGAKVSTAPGIFRQRWQRLP